VKNEIGVIIKKRLSWSCDFREIVFVISKFFTHTTLILFYTCNACMTTCYDKSVKKIKIVFLRGRLIIYLELFIKYFSLLSFAQILEHILLYLTLPYFQVYIKELDFK